MSRYRAIGATQVGREAESLKSDQVRCSRCPRVIDTRHKNAMCNDCAMVERPMPDVLWRRLKRTEEEDYAVIDAALRRMGQLT